MSVLAKKLFIAILALFVLEACSLKQSSTAKQNSQGSYDELFKEDKNLIPINSAEIQRILERWVKKCIKKLWTLKALSSIW